MASSPGPFAALAEKYIEAGYGVLPIMPGTKRPGYRAADRWIGLPRWQNIYSANRMPDDRLLDLWGADDTGIGVVCGHRDLVAVDIDTDDPALRRAIKCCLPPSPVAKRGQKGETLFYCGPGVESRCFDIDGRRVVDVIARGRQTVLPPTVHPATGKPYHWLGSTTLLEVDPQELSLLTVDIGEQLGQALAPFGWCPDKAPRTAASGPAAGGTDSDGPGRRLNDMAMANLDAWVPPLNLYKCRRARGGYEAVATWRPSSTGRPLEKRNRNLGISPQGIKDFGTGQGYTPLDLVMAADGCDFDTAFRVLSEQLGFGEGIDVEGLVPAHDPETGEIREQVPDTARQVPVRVETKGQGNGIDHGKTGKPTHTQLLAHFHGDPDFTRENEFLIYNTVPRVGGGLIAGQWGAFKTFLCIDMAAAIICATIDPAQRFCGEEIDRPGGVLFYFSEGEAEASERIDAALAHRGWPAGRPVPFAFIATSDLELNLSRAASVDTFIAQVRLVSAEMERRCGVPIVASFIDTMGNVSGFTKEGQGNDEVTTTVTNKAVRRIGEETDSFCHGVEHFGKAIETGTRGSSAKEATAYAVLAALGEKAVDGTVARTRLAVRKVKGGVAGREYPFTPRAVPTGRIDRKGRERHTLVIAWGPTVEIDFDALAGKAPASDSWKKARLLHDSLFDVLEKEGVRDSFSCGNSTGARAVRLVSVQEEYFKRRVAFGDTPKKQLDARRAAFKREIDAATDAGAVIVREHRGTQWIWPTHDERETRK